MFSPASRANDADSFGIICTGFKMQCMTMDGNPEPSPLANQLQIRIRISVPTSLSIPLINVQANDAEMKKAELNCKGSAPTASSLIISSDNKTVAILIQRIW